MLGSSGEKETQSGGILTMKTLVPLIVARFLHLTYTDEGINQSSKQQFSKVNNVLRVVN
jgi:hypothetical protein